MFYKSHHIILVPFCKVEGLPTIQKSKYRGEPNPSIIIDYYDGKKLAKGSSRFRKYSKKDYYDDKKLYEDKSEITKLINGLVDEYKPSDDGLDNMTTRSWLFDNWKVYYGTIDTPDDSIMETHRDKYFKVKRNIE
jgi:hypothetical protein